MNFIKRDFWVMREKSVSLFNPNGKKWKTFSVYGFFFPCNCNKFSYLLILIWNRSFKQQSSNIKKYTKTPTKLLLHSLNYYYTFVYFSSELVLLLLKIRKSCVYVLKCSLFNYILLFIFSIFSIHHISCVVISFDCYECIFSLSFFPNYSI